MNKSPADILYDLDNKPLDKQVRELDKGVFVSGMLPEIMHGSKFIGRERIKEEPITEYLGFNINSAVAEQHTALYKAREPLAEAMLYKFLEAYPYSYKMEDRPCTKEVNDLKQFYINKKLARGDISAAALVQQDTNAIYASIEKAVLKIKEEAIKAKGQIITAPEFPNSISIYK